MTIDNVTALNARDDMLWVVAHWTDLRARLRPGGGNALNGMPAGESDSAPIDTNISDLMFTITEQAKFYAHALMDETTWTPRTSFMPGLLEDVAQRYGHFTHGPNEDMGLEFCDDAHEWRRKVTFAIETPPPRTYVGPCRTDNCAGELYVREGREDGKCPECEKPFTLAEQREFLTEALETRLMTASEITSALVVLAHPTPYDTVKSWVRRGRLFAHGDGLYRLADALELAQTAERRKVGAGR